MTPAAQQPLPGATSFRAVQRFLAARLPELAPTADGGEPLELRAPQAEPPRVTPCQPLEGHGVRALPVDGVPAVGFAAFLDGTQQSRVVGYPDGVPVVFATVAAVVRVRANRRLHTWARGPRVERRLYAPCAALAPAVCEALRATGVEVRDTTPAEGDAGRHPLALLERALLAVKEDRERAEKGLAEAWCRADAGALFIDGSIQENEFVARAPCAVGVIKSHRTLYADGDALRAVLGLRRGQRSSVFRVASPRRTAVASWYLRLRDPAGRDPMWGLVRVEAADRGADEAPAQLATRADRISRWILAEAAPLALPDGRWDKMVYGIRDCEEFLRAVC